MQRAFILVLMAALVTGCAGSAMIFMMIACAEPPLCGGSPVNIS